MRFLFWNIKKKNNFFNLIADLVHEKGIDILLIAEYPDVDSLDLLRMINRDNVDFFYIQPFVPTDKVKIYTRLNPRLIRNVDDDSGLSAKAIYSPLLGDPISLVTCHLPSKLNKSEANQSERAEDIRIFVENLEERHGHRRTIICGDLNMNPFDEGMVKARGLHGVMEKNIAKNVSRIINKKEYFYFYNPMWGFLGDSGCGQVSGTMYYNPSEPITYFWHLYDQVLVRPDLIDRFESNELHIITQISSVSLLTSKGLLNQEFSDHLPIMFNLNI